MSVSGKDQGAAMAAIRELDDQAVHRLLGWLSYAAPDRVLQGIAETSPSAVTS